MLKTIYSWTTYTRAQQEHLREKLESRNQNFVKQRIPLPSGATLTICHGAIAAAGEDESE